jgi:hypothetical protein
MRKQVLWLITDLFGLAAVLSEDVAREVASVGDGRGLASQHHTGSFTVK